MLTFDTITECRNAIMDYRAGALTTEPEAVVTKVRDLSASPSPVDQIVRTGEYLYAKRAEISADGQSLAGGLVAFATVNGWFGLLENERGNKIVQAIRRDLGETPPTGVEWPDPADDPAELPQFV